MVAAYPQVAAPSLPLIPVAPEPERFPDNDPVREFVDRVVQSFIDHQLYAFPGAYHRRVTSQVTPPIELACAVGGHAYLVKKDGWCSDLMGSAYGANADFAGAVAFGFDTTCTILENHPLGEVYELVKAATAKYFAFTPPPDDNRDLVLRGITAGRDIALRLHAAGRMWYGNPAFTVAFSSLV